MKANTQLDKATLPTLDPRNQPAPRLGLCCQFLDEPEVRFRTTTARALSGLNRRQAQRRLGELAAANGETLVKAIEACQRRGIRAFRVLSGLWPLATHPEHRYGSEELAAETIATYRLAGVNAARAGIRLTFHPDQFVLLGSPRPEVTAASLEDLRLHAEQAELLGADCINIHGGGAYGDKAAALDRVARVIDRLPAPVRGRLTLENDDKVFHVRDLLPLCQRTGVPLVYDVHHHRCLPDGWTTAEATDAALDTWRADPAGREPLFHVSSPKEGWNGPQPWRHAKMIDPADFPDEWRRLAITVDVEAKAKERAVAALMSALIAK